MARLFSSGFENNNTGAGAEWEAKVGTVNINSTTVRTGNNSIQVNRTDGTAAYMKCFFAGSNQTGAFYARFYLYIESAPNANTCIFAFVDSGNIVRGNIQLNSSPALELWNSNFPQQGSDSATLNIGQWYRIEMYYENNTFTGYIDGVSFATGAGAAGGAQWIGLGEGILATANTAGVWYFDDVALNDSTGSYQNNLPGSGSILHLRPNAVGDANAWTRGGTDTGANWNQVSEVTPSNTQYNQSTTLNNEDLFNITDPNFSSAIINCVQVGVYFGADVAGSDPGFKLEIEKTSGGTITQGTEITPASATYSIHAPSTPKIYNLTLYNDPDGNPWTPSSLQSAQIGYKLTTDNTNNTRIGALWLLVEYTSFIKINKPPLRPAIFKSGIAR